MDDLLATVLTTAAGLFGTAGVLLGLTYMVFDTLA